MLLQGFETAQALADALANGTLHVCSPKQWTSLNYNDNVSNHACRMCTAKPCSTVDSSQYEAQSVHSIVHLLKPSIKGCGWGGGGEPGGGEEGWGCV